MSSHRLLVLHAITPIHVGTGRGEGIIDLPIARDTVTQHPLIPGSGVKGPLRASATDHFEADDSYRIYGMFGPDTDNASDHGSALRFSDARVLLMPTPSDAGTFAWATSPLVLARLVRDVGDVVNLPLEIPAPTKDQALVAEGSALLTDGKVVLDGAVYQPATLKKAWIDALVSLVFPDDDVWAQMLRQRIAILSDAAFDELARTGTDIRAHIRIDNEKGTVEKGALWYEESMPAESVFVSLVQAVGNKKTTADQALANLSSVVEHQALTFGGSKSTGMGRMRAHLAGGQ